MLVDFSGNPSASAAAGTFVTDPLAPTNIEHQFVPTGIMLSWDAPTTGGVSGFNVYSIDDSDDSATKLNGTLLGSEISTYLVTGLTAGTEYTYAVETTFTVDTTTVSSRSTPAAITFAGPGTADNPWLVSTPEELRSIATNFTSSAAANAARVLQW